MNLYETKLVWRWKGPRRKTYHTITVGVMARNAAEACARAAAAMLFAKDVDNVAGKASVRAIIAHGETVRRCRGNRWDGYRASDYTSIRLGIDRVMCGNETALR